MIIYSVSFQQTSFQEDTHRAICFIKILHKVSIFIYNSNLDFFLPSSNELTAVIFIFKYLQKKKKWFKSAILKITHVEHDMFLFIFFFCFCDFYFLRSRDSLISLLNWRVMGKSFGRLWTVKKEKKNYANNQKVPRNSAVYTDIWLHSYGKFYLEQGTLQDWFENLRSASLISLGHWHLENNILTYLSTWQLRILRSRV